MVKQSEELGVVAELKPDGKLRRRLRARKAHRVRAGVVNLLEGQANAHTRRAKRARKRGRFSPVLSRTANVLRHKTRRLGDRFHVPVMLVTDAAAHDSNSEE